MNFNNSIFQLNCPETRCYLTQNRSLLGSEQDFDAIVFNIKGIKANDMPKTRTPKQSYILWAKESAQNYPKAAKNLNGYINWTMTYKLNSDFPVPYGIIKQVKHHPEGKELDKFIMNFGLKNQHLANKTSDKLTIAWFVSNCETQSSREVYVNKLEKYLKIDIYGKCGEMKCPRSDSNHCYNLLDKQYKFYLSFENSLCEDYVTEKLFHPLSFNVIPIVYGGTDYNKLGPYHAYINVMDFKSPKQLAQYLLQLHQNDAKYAEYFWWKSFYKILKSRTERNQSFCNLCQRLHNKNESMSVYEDMHKWWVKDSHCKSKNFVNKFKGIHITR